MNAYKKYSLLSIITPCLLFLCYALLMLFADPLQLFHPSYLRENSFEENMRHQAAGIIHSYDFDGIVMGNSYMENASAKQCETLFGGNFVNLSLGGSSNYERFIVLEHALKQKEIKTVINVIDTNTNRTGSQNYPFDLWGMLYDDNPFNDFRVYFDLHYFTSIFMPSRDVPLERPNAWYKDSWYTARFGGFENWIKNANNQQIRNFLKKDLPKARSLGLQAPQVVTEERKEEIKLFINEIMVKQAENSPSTRFIYIFPPFSRLFYAYRTYIGLAEEYYYWHEAMVEISQKYKNIEVYVFADQEYVDDIKNYCDTNHFAEWINAHMFESIAQGQGRLTQENLAEFIALSRKKTQDFPFEKTADYLMEQLKNP